MHESGNSYNLVKQFFKSDGCKRLIGLSFIVYLEKFPREKSIVAQNA